MCKAISNKRAIKKAAVEAFPQAPSHSWATDKGDQQRLKCFDALFNTRPNPPPATPDYSAKQGNRRIEQSKSPTDGAPLVNAANLVSDTVLILQCKNQTTEATFSNKHNWLGSRSVAVKLRISAEEPLKAVWKASVDGHAAFAPKAVAFIRSLSDDGSLTIRTTRSNDKAKEATFDLGAVLDARNKMSRACNWNDTANEPMGSVNHSGSPH